MGSIDLVRCGLPHTEHNLITLPEIMHLRKNCIYIYAHFMESQKPITANKKILNLLLYTEKNRSGNENFFFSLKISAMKTS